MQPSCQSARPLVGPNYTAKEVYYEAYAHELERRERETREAELVAGAGGVMVLYQAEKAAEDG